MPGSLLTQLIKNGHMTTNQQQVQQPSSYLLFIPSPSIINYIHHIPHSKSIIHCQLNPIHCILQAILQLNIRMQILKDYHLCEDLTRLNHDEYFHSDFHTPEIYDALCTPSTPIQCHEQSRNRQIYFVNLSHTADKPVLIVLKWLVVAHEIAKGARLVRVVKEMQGALEQMGEPKPGTKYQQFLFQRLVKPYRHYLRKLCIVLQACAGAKTMGMQEWFMKYNLIKYALMEFSPVFPEFMPFFLENYPFLARIAAEVALDIELFLRQLKSSHKMQEFKLVAREELDNCEEALGRLREYTPFQTVESVLFTESEFCTGKIQHFFESASKIEGSILFA